VYKAVSGFPLAYRYLPHATKTNILTEILDRPAFYYLNNNKTAQNKLLPQEQYIGYNVVIGKVFSALS